MISKVQTDGTRDYSQIETEVVVCSDPKEASVETAENNRAAILLLDFQNEFVKKGGKLNDEVASTMEKTGILENVPKLVALARKMEAIIIYSPVVMKATGLFDSLPESKALDKDNAFKKVVYSDMFGLFTENTWNCEIIHELEPMNDDVILQDRSDFSAFAGTQFQSILKSNNINHLFITGFLTDVCVTQTSIDATKLVPEVSTYVIADACAAKSLDDHDIALEKLSQTSINVISCSEAESILAKCSTSIKEQRVLDHSDEWLMIDKIFSAAGVVGRNKSISFDELQSLIKSMPSKSSILSTLTNHLQDTGGDICNERFSRESMHRILFERKPRVGCFARLPLFITMVYMPILYCISTRLPFIFLALEITTARGGELWEVGLVLGVYQTSRAFGNLLIVVFGGVDPFKRLQILQIFFAFFGWLFLARYHRDAENSLLSFKPDKSSEGEGDIWPLFALFFVGLCETVVILQRSLMIETAKESPSGIINEDVLANRLSLQYSMVACGSVISYVFGGWLYTEYGYFAVCDFGIICQTAHLIGAIAYLALAKNKKKNLQGGELDGNDSIRSVIYQFQAASVIAKYSRDVANGTENALNSDVSGLSAAAIKAESDHVLNHSLREMFRCFFSKGGDDIVSMEELLKTIDKVVTGVSMASRRPLAMAIGKQKLSVLVLFLIKSKGGDSLTEREFISFWGPRIYLSMFESSQEASVSVIWPYMKAVVLTQAVAALCIGTFLSTALLSYTQRFEIDAAKVGILLGVGEGIGMIIILLRSFLFNRTNTRKKSKNSSISRVIKAIAARPLNVPFVLFVASIASMLFSIDNYVVAISCQMVFSSVNDLSVTLMNELIGTSLPAEKFRYYQGLGQWLRRLGNMVTAILGPLFFGINEGFPFVFFGGFVFVWALMLWVLMYTHAEKIQQNDASSSDDGDKGEHKKDNTSCFAKSVLLQPFAPFFETARTSWHVLEQRYYSLNKEKVTEELNSWKKAHVDISLMEHRIRRIAAALEVEKDQRRALEDRMYARVPVSEDLGVEPSHNII